ncbi:hypothetical protein Ciccas_001767 [Cichlidogyrus casuarinus]|uniref:Ig-like domain-containing protein n=1 Tax=Cichlidogyrus casuarinus TaxID=1844966 RepID=A0ABD2QJ51_9PLAT
MEKMTQFRKTILEATGASYFLCFTGTYNKSPASTFSGRVDLNILLSRRNQSVRPDETVTVSCLAHRGGSLTWVLPDGRKLEARETVADLPSDEQQEKLFVTLTKQASVQNATLHIQKVDMQDTGVYHCSYEPPEGSFKDAGSRPAGFVWQKLHWLLQRGEETRPLDEILAPALYSVQDREEANGQRWSKLSLLNVPEVNGVLQCALVAMDNSSSYSFASTDLFLTPSLSLIPSCISFFHRRIIKQDRVCKQCQGGGHFLRRLSSLRYRPPRKIIVAVTSDASIGDQSRAIWPRNGTNSDATKEESLQLVVQRNSQYKLPDEGRFICRYPPHKSAHFYRGLVKPVASLKEQQDGNSLEVNIRVKDIYVRIQVLEAYKTNQREAIAETAEYLKGRRSDNKIWIKL